MNKPKFFYAKFPTPCCVMQTVIAHGKLNKRQNHLALKCLDGALHLDKRGGT